MNQNLSNNVTYTEINIAIYTFDILLFMLATSFVESNNITKCESEIFIEIPNVKTKFIKKSDFLENEKLVKNMINSLFLQFKKYANNKMIIFHENDSFNINTRFNISNKEINITKFWAKINTPKKKILKNLFCFSDNNLVNFELFLLMAIYDHFFFIESSEIINANMSFFENNISRLNRFFYKKIEDFRYSQGIELPIYCKNSEYIQYDQCFLNDAYKVKLNTETSRISLKTVCIKLNCHNTYKNFTFDNFCFDDKKRLIICFFLFRIAKFKYENFKFIEDDKKWAKTNKSKTNKETFAIAMEIFNKKEFQLFYEYIILYNSIGYVITESQNFSNLAYEKYGDFL